MTTSREFISIAGPSGRRRPSRHRPGWTDDPGVRLNRSLQSWHTSPIDTNRCPTPIPPVRAAKPDARCSGDRGGDRSRRVPTSGAGFIQELQQLVSCEFDLFVPPLCCTVVAGDQASAVQAAEVSVDECVASLRLLRSALGEAEMPFGVLAPRV